MKYAGHPLRYSFLYPATRLLMRPLPVRTEGQEYDVGVTPELHAQGRTELPPDSTEPYVEYRCLIELTARALLRYDCTIFHAASFVWRDRAWLLTAPSGVGKTTQVLNWLRLFPDELTVISGDMPLLEARRDGSVWVHPSAWNGKECLYSNRIAPLGGLVLLEQGAENRIAPMELENDLMKLFRQIMVQPETEDEIRRMARLLDQTLRTAPSWAFTNLGDDASTLLLRETLLGAPERT